MEVVCVVLVFLWNVLTTEISPNEMMGLAGSGAEKKLKQFHLVCIFLEMLGMAWS